MSVLPLRELTEPAASLLPQSGTKEPSSLIESEIVIVDADGTEEPFDPASWFE